MGTFVANAHVRGADAEEVAEAVVDVLADEPAGEVALRLGSPWVSVYGGSELGFWWAAELSKLLPGADLLHVAVGDSDSARLELYRDGDRVAFLQQPPEAFDAKEIGEASRWAVVLVDPAAVDELNAIWADEPTFADQYVRRTAPLLSLDARRALGDFVDLEADPEEELERLTVGRPPEPPKTGPPRFTGGGGSLRKQQGVPGEPLEILAHAHSSGGPVRGLRVTVEGSALRDGLVEIGLVRVIGEEAAHRATFVTGRAVEYASGQHPTVSGIAQDTDLPLSVSREPARIAVEAPRVSGYRPHLYLGGVFAVTGRGALTVRFEAFGASEATWTKELAIEVIPAGRRPLRAIADANRLRTLWTPPTHLFAGLHPALGLSPASWPVFADILRRLLDGLAWAPDTELSKAIVVPERRAKTGSIRAKSLTAKRLGRWLEGAASVSLSVPNESLSLGDAPGIPGHAVMPIDALDVSLRRLWSRFAPGDCRPFVSVAVGREGRDPTELRRIESALVDVVEEVAGEVGVHQAYVGEHHADAYERACGIPTDERLIHESWVDRWLRIVARRLWLGPGLRSHLDEGRLLSATTVREVPGALALETESSGFDALEQALAPILPGGVNADADATRR